MYNVAVLIPTYNRAQIVRHAILQFKSNAFLDGSIRFYVTVDGTDDTMQVLQKLTSDHSMDIRIMPGARMLGRKLNGYLGTNLNTLVSTAMADGFEYLFQMDDDHILLKPMYLNPHCNKLASDESAGWIRLMGVGAHKYTADLEGSYWKIRWDSGECYIPSNRPHLKHIRFIKLFGLYPENKKLGETEEGYCHKCIDIAKAYKEEDMKLLPHVLVPLGFDTESSWDHIGDSWQLKGE